MSFSATAFAFSTKILSSLHHHPAQPTSHAAHLHAGGDAFGHVLHMRDHAHFAAQGLEFVERVHRHLQGFGIEAAKAFVNEERLHPHAVR